MQNLSTKEGKKLALVAYLTIIGWLIAYFLNKQNPNYFTKFHLKQALGATLMLALSSYIPSFVIVFINIKTILFTVAIVLIILGIINVVNEEEKTLPYLGTYFQDWFKTL